MHFQIYTWLSFQKAHTTLWYYALWKPLFLFHDVTADQEYQTVDPHLTHATLPVSVWRFMRALIIIGQAMIWLMWGRRAGSKCSMLKISERSSSLYWSEIGENVPRIIFKIKAGKFWKHSLILLFTGRQLEKCPYMICDSTVKRLSWNYILWNQYTATINSVSAHFKNKADINEF